MFIIASQNMLETFTIIIFSYTFGLLNYYLLVHLLIRDTWGDRFISLNHLNVLSYFTNYYRNDAAPIEKL